MKNQTREKLYQTNDLIVATFLIASGIPLDSMDRSDLSKVVFYFQRNEVLDSILETFWSFKASVEPRNFANVLKDLKTQIYDKN